MKATTWVVVVIAVGVGLWWWFGTEESPPAKPLEGPTDGSADAPEAGPTLTAAGHAPQTPTPARTTEADTAPEAAPLRHVLEGELTGLDPAVQGAATLTVTGLTAEYQPSAVHPEGTARPDGTFSIDVTDVFATKHTVVDLKVSVDHPGYMPSEARVPVTTASAQGNPRRYRARIPLTRAGLLTGRIETERGEPVSTAVGAFLLEDGKPLRGCKARVDSDEDGAYRLRVGKQGRYLIVAAGGMKSVPAHCESEVAPGTEVEAPTLVVEMGVSITGEVRFRGAPLGEAGVKAAPKAPEGVWLRMRDLSVVWSDGRVMSGKVGAGTDAAGKFEVLGLTPGRYRVQVDRASTFLSHMACERDSEQIVEAPASGVVLELGGCLITLAIVKGGQPVANPQLLIHGRGGSMSCTLDASGETEILMPAGEKYFVTASAKDLPSVNLELQAPADQLVHREVIDLGTKLQKPVLIVTLVAPEDANVDQAGFGFFKRGSSRLFPFDSRDVKPTNGRFRMEGLPPGPHRMKVRAGGPWWGGHGFYLEEAVDVEVPEDGEQQVRVKLRMGARLRIAVRNAEGAFLSVNCTLRDADGEEVNASYVTRTESGLAASYGALGNGSISSVDPALPAGTYEIELKKDGYFPKTLTVELAAGKTKDVEVTLQPTR